MKLSTLGVLKLAGFSRLLFALDCNSIVDKDDNKSLMVICSQFQ